MYRILILSSAAFVISGCSLINGGFNNDNQGQSSHAQSVNAKSGGSGYNNCGVSQCASGNSYSGFDSYTHAHDVSQISQYSQNSYGAPQQPSAQAYGSQVQAPSGYAEQNYGAPTYSGQGYGQVPQLRGSYGSRDFSRYKYGTLGIINYDKSSEAYGLQGRLGYQATKYFGAEAEGSFGVFSDNQTIGATELSSGVDYSVAAFGRGVVPLGQRFNVFGRAGYHVTEIDGSVTDATGTIDNSDTTDGFAYGGGAEFAITSRDAIRLDYTRYDLGSNDTDSLAVSYARKF